MVRKNLLRGLPPEGTKRWVARRKAAVVVAVRQGLITREEACRRYELSEEEFASWQWSLDNHGVKGLRITSLQRYRDNRSSRLSGGARTAATATQKASSKPAERGLQQLPDPYLTVRARI
jgi:Protein of unknown function (DUF1153)